MLDQKLISLLRCPIDGTPLKEADSSIIDRVNQAIAAGSLRDRHDQKISRPVDGGLANQSQTRIYPIREGIPSLVADEAIDL
ncbi:hypothetical protein Poly51_31660 [Rubripirellula tenax]|uniref:Trm112p-like protein n=1 Tax=Rubripirellula tenax TaxID=2528015 RepID=A0A5C6F252_9BACT|nr:Trm112 family protein [Rubripirellula tenax]TWU54447.1 hypothetical protein Poly51_31660 [Rubripirellula tenax]